MAQVDSFIRRFHDAVSAFGYVDGYAFLDEDFLDKDNFTALGNVYVAHSSIVSQIQLWNFANADFESLNGFQVYSGNLSAVPTLERVRFPKEFFKESKWSRKGYMKTRWQFDSLVVDLVNIHLFHDASNVIAVETPSVYSGFRRHALQFVLDRLDEPEQAITPTLRRLWGEPPLESPSSSWTLPYFIFGDFNFRLDIHSFVERLTDETDRRKVSKGSTRRTNSVNTDEEETRSLNFLKPPGEHAYEFTRKNSNNCVLLIEKKWFEHEKHDSFAREWQSFLADDKETREFPQLFETPIGFPPSYPWSEDVLSPTSYMKTRAPAWCDRVLMNAAAWRLLAAPAAYNCVGARVCMGDHKPVFLSAQMPIDGDSVIPLLSHIVQGTPSLLADPSAHHLRAECLRGRSSSTGAKSPLAHTKSTPTELDQFPQQGTETSDLKTTSRTEQDHSIIEAVLNLRPIPSSMTDVDPPVANVLQEHQIFTMKVEALGFHSEKPKRMHMSSAQEEPNRNMDYITVITLNEDRSSVVQDAASYGMRRSDLARLSLTSSATSQSHEKQASSVSTETPGSGSGMDAIPGGSVLYKPKNSGLQKFVRPKRSVESQKELSVAVSQEVTEESVNFGQDRAVLRPSSKRRPPQSKVLFQHSTSQTYSSIITVAGETGEPEIVYGRPVSWWEYSPKASFDDMKPGSGPAGDQSRPSTSSGSGLAGKWHQKESKSGHVNLARHKKRPSSAMVLKGYLDKALEASSVSHAMKPPESSPGGSSSPLMAKRCQTDSRLTGDTNSLAREKAIRQRSSFLQPLNDVRDWRLLREAFLVEMWTWNLLKRSKQE